MTTDVLALLDAKGIDYINKNKEEVGIVCLNASSHAKGQDTKPSLNINLDGKGAHCFACGLSMSGERVLRWLIGEDLDEDEFDIMNLTGQLRAMVELQKDARVGVAKKKVFFPNGEPWTEDFRGISKETYELLGATHVKKGRYADRICVPVYVNGNLEGVDARDLTGDAPAKYLRNKNSSCKTKWLYPYDNVKVMISENSDNDYVILSEGLFHSLNCVDKGFPGVCYFGVNNMSRQKIMMLLNLNVNKVIFWPDNDKAGIKAAQIICSMIAQWMDVEIADIEYVPDGDDLGDIPAALIEYGVSNSYDPELPLCLADAQDVKVKLANEPLTRCHNKQCPFNMEGVCANIVWLDEKG